MYWQKSPINGLFGFFPLWKDLIFSDHKFMIFWCYQCLSHLVHFMTLWLWVKCLGQSVYGWASWKDWSVLWLYLLPPPFVLAETILGTDRRRCIIPVVFLTLSWPLHFLNLGYNARTMQTMWLHWTNRSQGFNTGCWIWESFISGDKFRSKLLNTFITITVGTLFWSN